MDTHDATAPAPKFAPSYFVLSFGLMMNLGGLVWGAATIKNTVDELSASVQDLQTTTAEFQRNWTTIQTELGVLKYRVCLLEADGTTQINRTACR